MDIHSTIQKIGLEEKQVAVYLAVLESGDVTMTQLAKKAGLKRPTAYLAVEALQMIGLISEIKKGKRQIYSAAHPRRLLEILRSRQSQIEDVLPQLLALHNSPKDKPKIQVFEGESGMEQLYEELYQSLNNKEEALWFTRIDALREFFPIALTMGKRVLRSVKNAKIRELNYDNEAARCWFDETKDIRSPHHHVRLLPHTFEFGYTDNLIFANKLVIFSLKKDVFVIAIESEEIAKTYRAMFEWAWQMGHV